MKIDRTKLIELLVEKTGMDSAEVESQLKQLIDRILDAAERGKALEVKEFGMFYFDEHGDLKFEPSEELSTEINFKYAGMEHVELQPARDEADSEAADKSSINEESKKTKEQPPAEYKDVFDLDDEDADEEEMPIEDEETGPDGGALVSPPDEVKRDIDPFSGLLDDASSKMKEPEKPGGKKEEPGRKKEEPGGKRDEPEEDPFSFAFDDDSDDESESVPHQKPEREQVKKRERKRAEYPPKTTKPKPQKEESKKQRDPIMMVISIGLILVLAAAGYFIIPTLFQQTPATDPEPESTAQTEQATPADPIQDEAGAVITQVEPPEESQAEPPEGSEVIEEEEPIEEEAAEPEQPVYGLTGDLVDEANDGFSIVLHSLRSEERARSEAAVLASEGYRVLVTPRLVREETAWRVSVGQFPTLEEAQRVAAELPSPYNSNNFIQRIQTN